MEIVLPKKIKDYFYDKLLKSQLEKFYAINRNSLTKKSFCPILINSQNSYLSRFLLEKILNSIFPDEKNITINYEHKLNANKISFNVKMSKNHIEVSPGEYGINDKCIVGEYINEVTSMNNIVTGNKKNIIIWNVDKLGGIAFEALHNIIKNNEDTANFICVSQTLNKIDRSIFGSVILLHIENPDRNFYVDFFREFRNDFKIEDQKIESFLENIKLGYSEYNFNSFLKNIAIFYNFNLGSIESLDNSFKKYIETLYQKVTTKSRISDSFMEEIRNLLYDLYVYHFTYEEIVNLFVVFMNKDPDIDDYKMMKILEVACLFNTTSGKGNKQIIHLEAFIYNFMNIYNSMGKNDNKVKVRKTRKTKT